MWNKFKKWLCKTEYRRMEEWFENERHILHEEFQRRNEYLDNKYRMVMHQNEAMQRMMTDKAMLDPNSTVLFTRPNN